MFLLLHSQVQVGIAGSCDWTRRHLEFSKKMDQDETKKESEFTQELNKELSKKSSDSKIPEEKTQTAFIGDIFVTLMGDFNSWIIGVQVYTGKAFNNKSDVFEKDWHGGIKALFGKSFSQRFHLYLGAGVEASKLKDLNLKFKKQDNSASTNENTFNAFVAGINADLFLTHSLGIGVEASLRFPRSQKMSDVGKEVKANYRSMRIMGKLIWIIL